MTVPPRWPLEPLLAYAGTTSARQLALLVGAPQRTVQRAVGIGVSEQQADLYAARLGCHPIELWPVEYAALAEARAALRPERIPQPGDARCGECGEAFVALTRRHKYCGQPCQARNARRRGRAERGAAW